MPSRQSLETYLQCKAELEQAQRNMEVATKLVLVQMKDEHMKTMKNEYGLFTYVQRNTPVIDEKGLRRAMTARVFDKYTVRKLDRKKLEEAMDLGVVDTMLVAKFVTEREGEPYLKYTAPKEEEPTA